jgi:hypothetical protein
MRLMILCFALLVAQAVEPAVVAGQDLEPEEAAVRPVPRWPDGRVRFGPPPGETGHWRRTRRDFVLSGEGTNPELPQRPIDLKIDDVPFRPWSRGLWDYYRLHTDRDAPHARCKPSGGPRQVGTAYGFEIVDLEDLERVFIFDIGGPHSYRIVYMDGRPHPENLMPSYYGHSIGWWEGDTLVVDTVGFNERSWIDALGLVRTDQMHQIERFTRVDFDTLHYDATIDDPGAYTAPWTAGSVFQWDEGVEMFEYICQDNNQNTNMTIGDDGQPLSRDSLIVP